MSDEVIVTITEVAEEAIIQLTEVSENVVVTIQEALNGEIGLTGPPGASGGSTSAWEYNAKTNATSGYPGNGYLLWNNATQTSATSIIVSHLTDDDTDIELLLSFFVVNQKIFIQDRDDSSKNQVWLISGTPTVTGANTSTAYYTFPVTLVSSAGGAFTNNHSILFGQISVATNAVTSATTSDGTATLSTSTLTTGTLTVSTSGVFNATSYTFGAGAASAMITALDVLPLTSVITVTGTTPAFTEPLVDDGSLINGKRAWYTTYQLLSWYAGVWTLTLSDDATILYEATNTSDSDRPWLLTGWTVTSGSGQPTLLIDLQTLQPIEGASGTIAIVDDQEGRVAPSDMTGLGTNVATALGINIGSSGAIVTSNSTDTLTNKTLTSPAINSATIGTAATFNATSYTYGAGAAAAHRTALGLVSNADTLTSVYEWTKATGDYTATNVGTGTSSTATNVMQLNTLATAGSSALLRSDANDFRAWQKYTGTRQAVDWSKKTMHYVRISSDVFTGADTIFRIYLGLPSTLTTVQDLQSANTAIGFKVIAGEIFVQVSNGSAVTTTTTGVTMSAWLVYDCIIQSNGNGTWTATVNSTTVTGSGAPSATSAASNSALVMSATNGTTAAARRFFINNQKSMQYD